MRTRLSPGLVVLGALAALCGCRARADECADSYVVGRPALEAPRIDGRLGEQEWPARCWQAGLTFPWRDRAAPETAFCVLADGAALYLAFRVADEDVVVVEGDPEDESLVERGDRVELFLARDAQLDEYFSIEIDPRARVLDYRASFYRSFDESWDCPGLVAAAHRRSDGYDVEASISRVALESMGLALSAERPILRAGVFRAEFSHREARSPDESWISWIRPRVARPDFHVPSAFGCFRFDEDR